MKTYEEKAYSALKRIEKETERGRMRQRKAVRIVTPIISFCLVALLGIGIFKGGFLNTSDFPAPANYPDNSVQNAPENNAYAVYTDPVKLPENPEGTAADMLGCLVYKGKVYIQAYNFYSVSPDVAAKLVGEYVGMAKGTLNEWSSQEKWATEFASTYSGPVYKVNGYSEDFRLCIYVDADDVQWLQILENYDEIGLSTGADLFEERLHVMGNVESVTHRTHDDWNLDNRLYHELAGVTVEQFEAFLQELCDSPFERIDYKNDPDFYFRAEKQGHLYLNMKDGTTVELRLIDGGYVGCGNLGWIFVKMPGDLFSSVLEACQ